MHRITAKITVNVAIDTDELIDAVAEDYECDIDEVTMERIEEYLNNYLPHLKGGDATGVYEIEGGWGVEGFEQYTYERIEKILQDKQQKQ